MALILRARCASFQMLRQDQRVMRPFVRMADNSDQDRALALRLGYRTMARHKQGGFGVLYRAEDMQGVVHAGKILHPSPFGDAANAEARVQPQADALTPPA